MNGIIDDICKTQKCWCQVINDVKIVKILISRKYLKSGHSIIVVSLRKKKSICIQILLREDFATANILQLKINSKAECKVGSVN